MYPHPRLAHRIAVESWKWMVAVSLKVMKLIRSSQPARTPFWTGSNWYQLITASKHHLMTIPYHFGIAHVKHVFLNVLSCACAFVFCIFFPLARVNCPGLPVMLSKRQGQPADALRWKPHRYAKWHLWLHFPDWFSDTQTPAVRMILTVFHSRRALYVAMKTLTLTSIVSKRIAMTVPDLDVTWATLPRHQSWTHLVCSQIPEPGTKQPECVER